MRDERYAEDAWTDALLRERSLLYLCRRDQGRDELALWWSGDRSELLPGAKQTDHDPQSAKQ